MGSTGAGSTTGGSSRYLIAIILFAFTGYLIWQMFWFTNRYSVNLLYMDQWDFYAPLFNHDGIFTLFTWQHGPHRQGLGNLIIAPLAKLTNWNIRADAFEVTTCISLAAIAALLLKVRLFRTVTWTDLFIPATLLSMRQWETIIAVPNVSHSALPLLLLMVYAIACTIPRLRSRYVAMLIINLLAVFTGFGFFLGIVTPIILLIDLIHAARSRQPVVPSAVALVLALLTFGSFFIRYHFEPSAPHFRFPDPRFFLYPHMMALIFAGGAGFGGEGPIAATVGWIVMLCAIVVAIHQTRRLLAPENDPQRTVHRVIWVLIVFSLLFSAGVAVGRISFGTQIAALSRYVTLILPAMIGLYFYLLNLRSTPWRCAILIGATVLFTIFALHVRQREKQRMISYAYTKLRWSAVYRQTHNIELADRAVHSRIHPDPAGTHMQNKLDYLEQRQLSLFSEPSPIAP